MPNFYCLGNSRYWFRVFDSNVLLLILLVPGNRVINHIGSFSHLSDPFVSIAHNVRLTLKGVCAENWSHIVHGRRSSCCVIHFYVFNYPEIHCTVMFTCSLMFYDFGLSLYIVSVRCMFITQGISRNGKYILNGNWAILYGISRTRTRQQNL